VSSSDDLTLWGREVIRREADALGRLETQIGESFTQTVRILERTIARGGRILLTGSGKSGLVARKIAATFCSTGAPAVFLHPADADHGDVGLLTGSDALLALSRSGDIESLASASVSESPSSPGLTIRAPRSHAPRMSWSCSTWGPRPIPTT
jgi:arabinose-5-phosphate isomerase